MAASRQTSTVILATWVGILLAGGAAISWRFWSGSAAEASSSTSAADSSTANSVIGEPARPVNPADARQKEILEHNLNQPGDPELMKRYAAINTAHFGGALPAIPVRWEPALAEVAELAKHGIALEGMFGNAGKRMVILLNPEVKDDSGAFLRALCHEMVHAHLFVVGDKKTNHGPAFKTVLDRLSSEGAFPGIAASDVEKRALKLWLDAESARIDAEQAEMARAGGEIIVERAALDQEIAAINAGRGGNAESAPAANTVAELEKRRRRFNDRVIDTNARLDRDRADLAHFNREVDRYNLMMAYPDGLDEESVVRVKTVK